MFFLRRTTDEIAISLEPITGDCFAAGCTTTAPRRPARLGPAGAPPARGCHGRSPNAAARAGPRAAPFQFDVPAPPARSRSTACSTRRRGTTPPSSTCRYEWFPGDNATPPVKTEALITFDNDNLYVAFRAHDPDPSADPRQPDGPRPDRQVHPGRPRRLHHRHLQRRAPGLPVPRQSARRAGRRRVQRDRRRGGLLLGRIWATPARITEDGLRGGGRHPLPPAPLPAHPEVQTWGVEFFRSYPRSVRHRISSRFTDRARDCTLCEENKITGFQGIAPGRNIELDPHGHRDAHRRHTPSPTGRWSRATRRSSRASPARWGITPNMTLNATINPDFSQVEADALQLEVNTRFALRFPGEAARSSSRGPTST